jgi:hypothetical protein
MRVLVPVLALCLVPHVEAQQRVQLTRPDAAFDEPFTLIRGVRELRDGRVIVTDLSDKIVQILDFRTGRATRIGREGRGPGEYVMPATLWPTPDGQTLLQDIGKMSFLVIDAQGGIGREISAPRATAGGGGRVVMATMEVRGADARGRLYHQGAGYGLMGGATALDSVPLLRWDVAADRVDTLAWKPLPPEARPQVSGGGGQVRVIQGMRAWPAEAQWGVAADGRIALVTPDPYRVTWITPGAAARTGPAVPYTPIRVTEAEKRAYREARARTRPITMSMGPGGAAIGQGAAAPTQDPEWPETIPPFSGPSAVLVTPEGEVWVERTRPASDRTPRYDVFDGTGQRVREVTLRPRSRVVAFGQGTVYVVRMDEDDLQYLERYRR